MGLAKSIKPGKGISTFAMLIDDIKEMTEAQQKLLWMQINKDKLSALAKAIDASTNSGPISQKEIARLVKEAKAYAQKKKKG